MACFPQRQPGLAGDEYGEFFATTFQLGASLLKNFASFIAAGGGVEAACSLDGGLDILAGGQHDGSHFPAMVGIVNRQHASTGDGLAGGQTGEVHGWIPLQR